MRRFVLTIVFLLLANPGSAELGKLLKYQKLGDPGAFVSSVFHDWRTVSKYRSRPGLHAGYDIAMLAGSPVRAAWPGVVVAITPWYGTEYGVTVRHADGHEATYGHIAPSVGYGQEVRVGDVLGLVVVDHVDVKMRNSRGEFVDFAHSRFEDILTRPTRPEKQRPSGELLKQLEETRQQVQNGLASDKELRELEARVEGKAPEATAMPQVPLPRLEGRAVTDWLVRSAHGTDLP